MVRFFLFFLLFSPALIQAQTTIVGRVILQGGEAVSGVNIFCQSNRTGASSDSLGYFSLMCELPCVLEFSHVNYKTEICTIKNNETPFVVVLRNKFNNLKEVVVTGKATADKILSSKKGIEMIPAILGEQDLLKYLATTPGIVTTNALDPGIYVRGGNSSENSFMTNDIEIASPEHLTGILSTFDPFILSNSTVYKSGYPARYNGSLSAYINMRPDPGNKQTQEGEITVGLVSSAIKAKGPLLKNHTSFAASLRTSYLQAIAKLYNRSIKGVTDQNYMPEYGFNDATLSIDSRLSDKWRLNAFGLFTIDDLTMKLTETSSYDFNWHTFSGNAGATYSPNARNTVLFQAGVKSTFSKGDGDGTIPMGGGNRHTTAIGQITYTRVISDQLQIITGSKFEQARFETANKPDGKNNLFIKSSDKRFNLSEIHVDLIYNINKNFLFEGGANYQFYNGASQNHSFSPRAKISFSSGSLTLWADYAQTVQYLSLYPYFTVKTPVDIWYPLGKNMNPAICHQYSVGAGEDLGSGISAYAGLFYKKMRNAKDFSSGITTEYTALTDNMIEGSGYAKGIELNFAYTRHNFNTRINYTLSESKRKFADINDGKAFNPPYDVKHNLVFNNSWDVTPRLTLNTLWVFSSGVYTTFPVGVVVAHNITDNENKPILIPVYTNRYNYKLPDNHRLDVNLDYTIPYKKVTLKLSIGAYNVYNQSNPSFVYFKPEEDETNQTKFTPKSKVILPFIPYISLRLKW